MTVAARIVLMSCVDSVNGIQHAYSLQYRYQHDDGGRSTSKRPRQSNDCTVRALAIARRLDYDAAYDMLADAGRKCARGFHMPEWLNAQPWAFKRAFQAIKGQRRMNPAAFCAQHPEGVYICRTAKHVFTVIDGTLHDDFEQRPDRCIYTAWRIAEPVTNRQLGAPHARNHAFPPRRRPRLP